MTAAERSAFVYLDDLLDANEKIYVRNTSAKRGIVVLTLSDGARVHREPIPNTKYPICLSNKATPAMLRNSSDFRRLLDKEILSLVPRAEAEAELAKTGVREAVAEAYDRIQSGGQQVKSYRSMSDSDDDTLAAMAVKAASDISTPTQVLDLNSAFSNGDLEDADSEDGSDVQIRVQTLVESLNNKDLKSRQVKHELMSLTLTAADLAYLIDSTTGIVQKYAKELFAEMGGSFSEDSED